jgi:hypothetical protein
MRSTRSSAVAAVAVAAAALAAPTASPAADPPASASVSGKLSMLFVQTPAAAPSRRCTTERAATA